MEDSRTASAGRGEGIARIVGRSSSHFTRVVRIFAHEFDVPHQLQVVESLLATDTDSYGGNPGLRVPSLLVPGEPAVYGCLNSCRSLGERSARALHVLWPEALTSPIERNAQELTLQSMSTEVSWLMISTAGGEPSGYAEKLRTALDGMLAWLNEHADCALDGLSPRDLSFFEVSLFCLLEHLPFRNVLSVESYANLLRFRDRFSTRASAVATPFQFDTE